MQLDPSIITRKCIYMTARQRRDAYEARLKNWLQNADAAEQIAAAPVAIETKPAALPVAHNISQFLRGAK